MPKRKPLIRQRRCLISASLASAPFTNNAALGDCRRFLWNCFGENHCPSTVCPTFLHIFKKSSKTLLTQKRRPRTPPLVAQMAELVDAPASGAGTRKGVEVRVLFWAPISYSELFTQFWTSKKARFAGLFRFESLSISSWQRNAKYRPLTLRPVNAIATSCRSRTGSSFARPSSSARKRGPPWRRQACGCSLTFVCRQDGLTIRRRNR